MASETLEENRRKKNPLILVFTTTRNIQNTEDILMHKFEMPLIYFSFTKKAMPKPMNCPRKARRQQVL